MGPTANVLIDVSLPYAGTLVIVGVPRGSTWSLTLSDVPNVRDADAELAPSDRRRSNGIGEDSRSWTQWRGASFPSMARSDRLLT